MRSVAGADIYCLTDEALSCGRSNIDVVAAMLENDIKLIQYREKEKKAGEMYSECLQIRQMTREAGCTFIVNDHIDIAMLVGADGVHIGQEDLPVSCVRELVGPDKIIGLSTHSPVECQKAIEQGVDYIGVGPVFFTQTKKDVCAPVGFEYLDHVVKQHSIPFVAIGGIKIHNIGDVAAHGAECCALVSEIVGADDIGKAIRQVRMAMATGKGSL